MKINIEIPPSDFSNLTNHELPLFNYSEWRKSIEWKFFVAGYNSAVRQINEKVKAQYNMGETSERVFGRNCFPQPSKPKIKRTK